MAKKRMKPEQVVTLLRQIEVAVANGKTTPQACKEAEVTEQTYYRWRKEYGGLKLDQAKRLKQLEGENARLKRLLADAELDKAILEEAASGKYWARRSGARRSSTCEPCWARTACRSAGRAGSWASAARRSGARPAPRATSPRWRG